MIKEKSIALYIPDGKGGTFVVSKNAVTRLNKKIAKGIKTGQTYNHGKLRIYVHWFERRNFEMRKLIEDIGFKVD